MRVHTMRSVFVIGLLLLSAALLGPMGATNVGAHSVTTRPRPMASEGADDNIAALSERWAKLWSAKDPEGLASLYADDAVFLTATGDRINGREAIGSLFRSAVAANASKLSLKSQKTERAGDLAYDTGDYEEMTNAGGVTRVGHGTYLVVARRDGQGRWLIVVHMWTDAPAPGAVDRS